MNSQAIFTVVLLILTDGDNLLVCKAGQYTMCDYLVQGIPIFILQTIVLMSFFAVALL